MSLRELSLTRREASLIDLIDRILDKGLVVHGDITLAVSGIELLSLKINLVLASIETAKKYGIELPWEKWERERKQREKVTGRIRRNLA